MLFTELSGVGENYGFQIVFHGINNRTYYLTAESQEMYVSLTEYSCLFIFKSHFCCLVWSDG